MENHEPESVNGRELSAERVNMLGRQALQHNDEIIKRIFVEQQQERAARIAKIISERSA